MRKPPDSLIQWILEQYKPDIQEHKYIINPNKTLSDLTKRQLSWFLGTKSKCENIPVGDRSEKDFDLLCVGIKVGLSKEVLYNEVKNMSKFAERDVDYFNYTYNKALQKVEKQFRGD